MPREAIRVKIKTNGDPFDGSTGNLIDVEMDGMTRMYRVKLDKPVKIEGLSPVTEDLWAGEFLELISYEEDEDEVGDEEDL